MHQQPTPLKFLVRRLGIRLDKTISAYFKKKKSGSRLQKNDIQPPVFILGHWRSGTTYLHSLMAQDGQFGVLTNTQAFFPWSMMVGKKWAAALMRLVLPKQRWDGVALAPDSPQEEEFALQRLFGESAYLGWRFPNRLPHLFRKYGLLQFDRPEERAVFKKQYADLLKMLAGKNSGKTLLLKNPPNTGRVNLLLELFPNARFIYLHRRPDHTCMSTLRMHQTLVRRFAITSSDTCDLDAFVPAFHAELTAKYEQDKSLIPDGQLVEIGYAHFIKNPMGTLWAIYRNLGLNGFENARSDFEIFIKKQQAYQPKKYGKPVAPNVMQPSSCVTKNRSLTTNL